MKFAARWISTFFGAGYFPVAPGTFACAVVALGYRYGAVRLEPLPYVSLIVVIFFLGVMTADVHSKTLRQKDPRPIVIDEVVGQLIAFFSAPAEWGWIFLGFFLFRFFDILKPRPIRDLERLPGGWGIMTDDVLAGLVSAFIVQAVRWIR
jgi:phosphatidylglycerophosphatase A